MNENEKIIAAGVNDRADTRDDWSAINSVPESPTTKMINASQITENRSEENTCENNENEGHLRANQRDPELTSHKPNFTDQQLTNDANMNYGNNFCMNCGYKLQQDALFCPKCGHKVGNVVRSEKMPDAKRKVKQKHSQNFVLYIILAVCGVVAAIVVFTVIFFLVRGVQAKSITLDSDSMFLEVGETWELSYMIEPENTKDQEVSWSSSDTDIATVSNGEVTGVTEGDCVITITTKNGKSDTCEITVTEASPDLSNIYDLYCSPIYATIAEDGSYLAIDTNPEDIEDYTDDDAIQAIIDVSDALGIPDSVINRMSQTRALDGVQSYDSGEVEVTWSYHPDNGLEVQYSTYY